MVSITSHSNRMQVAPQAEFETNIPFSADETPQASQLPLFDDYDALGKAVIKSNLQHGFTQVPNNILTCPDISPRAKRAYEALLYHARQKDTCYPGHKRLATLMGCSEDTIQRGLKDLRDYLVRVDETGRLVVDHACPACSLAQESEPNPNRKPFCRCHVHTCLVVWVRRGLTRTNIYVLPPMYTTLKALQDALEAQGGEEIVFPAKNTQPADTEAAVSENRSVRHQEPAICGSNHTKNTYIQGNEDSNSSTPGGEAVAIGNQTGTHQNTYQNDTTSRYSSMHEMPTEERKQTDNPTTFSHRNRTSNPTEEETSRENAKQANGVNADERLRERHRDIRAAAAAGIDIQHLDELNRQNRRASASQSKQARELPEWLQQAMIDFSRDLNDSNRAQSNVTNLDRIYVHCRDYHGLTDEQFYYLMEDMKKRARRAVIMDVTPEGKPARAKYFFTCLYNEVGYRPAKK